MAVAVVAVARVVVARVVVARVAMARWVKESEGDGGVGEPSSSPCHR